VVVPREIQAEIAVLKGIVAANVMSTNERKPLYSGQRTILAELASVLLETGPAGLDPGFATDWNEAATDAQRKRAVVDQVSSLTDQSAMVWHKKLVS
jgi:dGTPase